MELWTIVEPLYDWCSDPSLSTKVQIVWLDPADSKTKLKTPYKLVDRLQQAIRQIDLNFFSC